MAPCWVPQDRGWLLGRTTSLAGLVSPSWCPACSVAQAGLPADRPIAAPVPLVALVSASPPVDGNGCAISSDLVGEVHQERCDRYTGRSHFCHHLSR